MLKPFIFSNTGRWEKTFVIISDRGSFFFFYRGVTFSITGRKVYTSSLPLEEVTSRHQRDLPRVLELSLHKPRIKKPETKRSSYPTEI